jgi:hypothetical protein
MKKPRNLVLVAAVGLCVSGTAAAQTLEPTPTVMGSLGETSALRLGVTLAPMPAGKLKGKVNTPLGVIEGDTDLAFAFALAPVLDYSINQFLFVGLAPQYVFNVKAKDGGDSAGSELDLRLRVGGNAKVADTLMLYGYLAPGYGIVMPGGDYNGDNPKGFVLGFAGGAMLDFTPSLFGNAEVGYQVGYQKVSAGGLDSDFKTNYFHVGIGLGYRL